MVIHGIPARCLGLMLFILALTVPAPSALASPTTTSATLARVRQIQQIHQRTESLIHNLTLLVRYTDYRLHDTPKEFPTDEAHWTRRMENAKYCYDNQGRMKIQRNFKYPNQSGQYLINGKFFKQSADITKTYNLIEERDSFDSQNVYLVISKKDTVNALRKPTDFMCVMREPVSRFLSRAIKTRMPMRLVKDEPTTCALVVEVPENQQRAIYTLFMDPTRQYYLTRFERRLEGRLIDCWSSMPQMIAKDIWLPVCGQQQTFRVHQGKQQLEQETDMETRARLIQLNKDWPDSIYTLKSMTELLSGLLGKPCDSFKNVEYGHDAGSGGAMVAARFDLSTKDFNQFFDGQQGLPAASDFKAEQWINGIPSNGKMSTNTLYPYDKETTNKVFPWCRPEELNDPVFVSYQKPQSNPQFTAIFYYAAGREIHGIRRVYLFYRWDSR